jgi:hypothetical protein
VEHYDPFDPSITDFVEGPPCQGFRNHDEAIRPYHKNPEWHIWPEPVGCFERDQKTAGLYTLATGMFQDINKAIREDDEDGMRRLAPIIWEMRNLLKFEVSKICTPEGRRCRPFVGKVVRGLTFPKAEVEEVANLYQVGTEFTWPSFTSCQTITEEDEKTNDGNYDKSLWPFDGNLNFEIECNIDPKELGVAEVFAPVRIGRFLGGSNEVLFPPHTKFKVVGERPVESVKERDLPPMDVYTKILEVVELPSPLPKPR